MNKELEKKKSERIFEAAVKLFLTHGIKKTTMDEIAQSANVSKVTIYKYYGDKDAFYGAVGQTILEAWFSRLKAEAESDKELTDRMTRFVGVMTSFVDSGHLGLCIDLAKMNSEIEDDYGQYQHAYRELILRLIEEGKQHHIICEEVDNEILYYYIDMGISYYQHNLEYREKMSHRDFQVNFMTFIWSNLFSDYSKFIVD